MAFYGNLVIRNNVIESNKFVFFLHLPLLFLFDHKNDAMKYFVRQTRLEKYVAG